MEPEGGFFPSGVAAAAAAAARSDGKARRIGIR